LPLSGIGIITMWPSNIPKPSDKVRNVMMGHAHITDDVRPMVERECYLAALQVIRNGNTTEKRKAMLGHIPTGMRLIVEAHVKMLWPSRAEIKQNPRF